MRPDQLISALLHEVGPEGAVVMSAATTENSSNSGYTRAALDGLTPAARSAYLSSMPPFDRAGTPVSASAGGPTRAACAVPTPSTRSSPWAGGRTT
ncbi:AAC(3) family N-acetyltransferase [Kitasatospora sp. NPDC059795]|uniref:AAC(3) family N-acetyltransferase n=1 Tax=Kitasatospora sp. NPDC059795 TaxID=3346949 RepID=UPI00365E7941